MQVIHLSIFLILSIVSANPIWFKPFPSEEPKPVIAPSLSIEIQETDSFYISIGPIVPTEEPTPVPEPSSNATTLLKKRFFKGIDKTTITLPTLTLPTITLPPPLPTLNSTLFFKRHETETTTENEATKTEMKVPSTEKPDIFHHLGAYLDNFHNPQEAVSFARDVSSNIAYAKATPTYNAKSLLRKVYQNVPTPTSTHTFEDLIDDIYDGHDAVDNLMDSVIHPFLRH